MVVAGKHDMIIERSSMTKGLTCGAFDLLHAGHVLFLKECKAQCDFLIVAIHIDPSIEKSYKNKPVETVEERIIRLEGCRYVDQVVTYNGDIECRALKRDLKPDMTFHGEDHEGRPSPGDDLGIRKVYIPRPHDYGSGRLRERVKERG